MEPKNKPEKTEDEAKKDQERERQKAKDMEDWREKQRKLLEDFEVNDTWTD